MIKIENISFSYPVEQGETRPILTDVSLDIHPGESIVVMGHNGSGKTTFARCLNGLLTPTSGRILVDDFDPTTVTWAMNQDEVARFVAGTTPALFEDLLALYYGWQLSGQHTFFATDRGEVSTLLASLKGGGEVLPGVGDISVFKERPEEQ